MAKTKTSVERLHRKKPKKKRKGIHSKTKASANKNAKLYKKPYAGQGR